MGNVKKDKVDDNDYRRIDFNAKVVCKKMPFSGASFPLESLDYQISSNYLAKADHCQNDYNILPRFRVPPNKITCPIFGW